MVKKITVEIVFNGDSTSKEARSKLIIIKEDNEYQEVLSKVKLWMDKDEAMSIILQKRNITLTVLEGTTYNELDDDYVFENGELIHIKLVPNKHLMMVMYLP